MKMRHPQPDTPNPDTPDESEFPRAGSSEEQWRFLLQYAILAPSNRNSQPWLWRLNGRSAELYADRTRALPHLDPDNRELILSCGAALLQLRLAIAHFGLAAEVELLPDRAVPDLLAVIRLGREYSATPDEERLFAAIPLRHTNRQPFAERDLPAALNAELQTAAEREGAQLLLIEEVEARLQIIKLIARSIRAQGHDPRFVEETMNWYRPNRYRLPSADGIPEYAASGGGLLSHYATDVGEAQSRNDELLAWSAPLIAVLQTAQDTPRDWLAAGQSLTRVLLRAAADGVQASFFNSPIEVITMLPELQSILQRDGVPQAVFRLGYPSYETGPTPRRAVSEVIESPAERKA
jgi:hypothetical protein